MKPLATRTADEAARRIIALACVGAASNDFELRNEILSWLVAEAIEASLSPKERGFLNNPSPSEQEIINFSWSSEAIAVIGWALGLQGQLEPPIEQSSVEKILDQIPAPGDPVFHFINSAKIRPSVELHEYAARILDIHSWCRSAQNLTRPERHGYNIEIAQEQHRAFNWLVRYEESDWDDVATDT